MNDEIVGCKTDGSIMWGGIDILSKNIDPVPLRRKVGMVFSKTKPFPKKYF
jgi:phosphate transport system ATP-binding protein